MDAKGACEIRGLMQGCFLLSWALVHQASAGHCKHPGFTCRLSSLLLETALLFHLHFPHLISVVTWLDN